MIIDDEWLRIGSSNICNRSMGVDTECDVTIDAQVTSSPRRHTAFSRPADHRARGLDPER
jgi:phosphatidylserine/phosphatidylglycerophosphate/cardiolipin synthase-like enzyme